MTQSDDIVPAPQTFVNQVESERRKHEIPWLPHTSPFPRRAGGLPCTSLTTSELFQNFLRTSSGLLLLRATMLITQRVHHITHTHGIWQEYTMPPPAKTVHMATT